MNKKKKNPLLEDFDLIPDTAGVICNGVYLKKDKSEIKIKFAWGKDLHYKPLEDNEISL